MDNKLTLSNYFEVTTGAHILYVFEDNDLYISNLMAYILDGVERGHALIIIDSPNVLNKVEENLTKLKIATDKIYFYDHYTYYGANEDFHSRNIANRYLNVLSPLMERNIPIRTWAHVIWKEQNHIETKLEHSEHMADETISNIGIMSICAYNATNLPSTLQTKMMRSHEYLMTDSEFVRSPIYKKFNPLRNKK